jgi:hypothetical protein
LPEGRHHATIRALYEGTIRVCVSQALLDEIRDVLSRPVSGNEYGACFIDKLCQDKNYHGVWPTECGPAICTDGLILVIHPWQLPKWRVNRCES